MNIKKLVLIGLASLGCLMGSRAQAELLGLSYRDIPRFLPVWGTLATIGYITGKLVWSGIPSERTIRERYYAECGRIMQYNLQHSAKPLIEPSAPAMPWITQESIIKAGTITLALVATFSLARTAFPYVIAGAKWYSNDYVPATTHSLGYVDKFKLSTPPVVTKPMIPASSVVTSQISGASLSQSEMTTI